MHLMILRFVFIFWMTLLLIACTKKNKDINNKYQFVGSANRLRDLFDAAWKE